MAMIRTESLYSVTHTSGYHLCDVTKGTTFTLTTLTNRHRPVMVLVLKIASFKWKVEQRSVSAAAECLSRRL